MKYFNAIAEADISCTKVFELQIAVAFCEFFEGLKQNPDEKWLKQQFKKAGVKLRRQKNGTNTV